MLDVEPDAMGEANKKKMDSGSLARSNINWTDPSKIRIATNTIRGRPD